ncbi:MAG: mechanosensitive ion channel [Gammaproteobacteria bacterium]|nr:mechanosensitive ion channel [Gammaproteobacteria bacterium]
MESEIDLETLEKFADLASELIIKYAFQILGAIVVLILGWFVARWVSGLILKLCQRASLDVTLSKFFADIAKGLVLIFVLIIALGKFGITIAPFIAALGAVAFGGTLALQGPLSNYGAGLTIILTRPFIVSDTIRIQGVTGIVEVVKLAYTQLSTEDGEVITIPNKLIVGEILHNSNASLIVEGSIGVAYDSDTDKAVELIREVLGSHPDVVDTPTAQIGIQQFADSAIEIGFRYWVPTSKYYEVMYAVNGRILSSLNDAKITIPFPQRDVHIIEKA